MDILIQHILFKMRTKDLISGEDEDVYRFGLECLLLKMIHYLSYIFIGFALHMMFPMIVSVIILIVLKSKTGGYHAKTRLGCYFFSCLIVFLIYLLNEVVFPIWLLVPAVLFANIVIWSFAPIENVNRELDQSEKKDFRRQALLLLCFVDTAIVVTTIGNYVMSQWLLNGLLMEAGLIILGKCHENNV